MNKVAQIRMIPINDLKLAEYNPRKKLKPTDREYRELKKSIEEHGFAESIVVNKDLTEIGGHQRIHIAKRLGYTELPCTVMDLDKPHEKALNIALNKINGFWDEEKLAELIGELDQERFDFACIGFNAPEVSELFNRVYDVSIRRERDEELYVPYDYRPISRLGDIWELGRHRIICGDATEWRYYLKLLENTKVDLVCVDSPYFVNYHNRETGGITNDNLTLDCATAFLRDTYTNLFKCMKDDATIYTFYATTRSALFFSEFVRAGFRVGGVPVWVKDKVKPNQLGFNFKYEPIIFGWKEEGSHHWYGSLSDTNVLEYPTIRNSARDGYGHPTSKPLQLIAYLIRMSSRQNCTVADTFLGSGTTLIACEQLNRKCYGMEIEPRFVDLCCRRYISFKESNHDVYLIRDGKRYSWLQANMLPKEEAGHE